MQNSPPKTTLKQTLSFIYWNLMKLIIFANNSIYFRTKREHSFRMMKDIFKEILLWFHTVLVIQACGIFSCSLFILLYIFQLKSKVWDTNWWKDNKGFLWSFIVKCKTFHGGVDFALNLEHLQRIFHTSSDHFTFFLKAHG